jgi:hypothetical protein
MSYAPLDESGRLTTNGTTPVHHADVDEINIVQHGNNDDRRRSLSEPLTNGDLSSDPFYVFREDLCRQLERVDETLTEFLRIVHQTVRLSD